MTEPMSPRQHYAAASRLITEALSKVEAEPTLTPAAKEWGNQHLIDVARVHAILATVPQRQFDEWKRATDAEYRRPTNHACGSTIHPGTRDLCDNALCQMAENANRSRLQLGDIEPCRHGRSESRCDKCHTGERPRMACGACGTPSWATRRALGSRCDLPGCGGFMMMFPGPQP